jgi:hypothetical protein
MRSRAPAVPAVRAASASPAAPNDEAPENFPVGETFSYRDDEQPLVTESDILSAKVQTAPRLSLLAEPVRAEFERRIEAAIGVHETWMANLREAIATGASPLSVETVERDTICPIGRWLAEEIPAEVRSTVLYTRSKLRHAQFHRDAARVLALAFARDPAASAAIAPGGFFATTASELRAVLYEWREHARA